MQFTDQIGQQITLTDLPKRILSLVPSQTELLFDLGLEDRIVGITKFCIHPKEKVKYKTVIGGTKNFRFDVIDQLKPDLIIGNKEENYKDGIETLQLKYPVWMSDIYTLEDALAMTEQVGALTGTTARAKELKENIKIAFDKLKPLTLPVRAAYFIWRKPFMAAAQSTIIDHIMQRCGFENTFGRLLRYPEITLDLLQQVNPQLILLSSEPFPFKEKHVAEFQKICPQAHIKVVDGEMFSWYGSRLIHAPAYLQNIIDNVRKSLNF